MAQKNYCAKYRHLKRALENISTVSSGNVQNKRAHQLHIINNNDLNIGDCSTSSSVEDGSLDCASFEKPVYEYDGGQFTQNGEGNWGETIPDDEDINRNQNVLSEPFLEDNSANTRNKFISFLRDWSKDYSVSHVQLNQLLKGLNSHLHLNLPLDARTILHTQRCTNIEHMSTISGSTGEFIYLGIENNLKKFLASPIVLSKIRNNTLKLIFNIDGVPLNNSTSRQFWPILGKIWINNFNIYPFAVAIFCGNGKPHLQSFFREFIEDINNLLQNGFMYNQKVYVINILCFTCDAPARAYVKAIKGHNGKYGCERCTQEGTYSQGRMLFKETTAPLRTDASFRSQEQAGHHNGISPLLNVVNLNMITTFVLDSMHLCFIGVMKKMLRYWYSDSTEKLHLRDRTRISEYLEHIAQYIPTEFNRKSRGLKELENWKATEFRLFLLYTGPIVLQNVLPAIKFNHFLLFHCAFRILFSNDISIHNIHCARAMLNVFVNDFLKLYGTNSMIYNVHNILHITDDVENLGVSLNDSSCFPFESFLGKLVNMIRTPNKPLSQVVRRLSETQTLFYVRSDERISNDTIHLNNCVLSSTKFKDGFILLPNAIIIKIISIDDFQITGHKCVGVKDLYTFPFQSSHVGVFQFKDIGNKIVKFSITDIVTKLIVVKEYSRNSYIAIEMLHTF